jgi:cell filamentation protein
MDRVEARALAKATDILIREYDQEHQFCATDICHFHKTWLGEVYEWAGKYRNVNITKNNFTFAMAAQIPELMKQFEKNQLSKYTPCIFKNRGEVIKALAEAHTELLLIHPFRDGNGRVARLLSTLMALQAGLPLLDFNLISEYKKQEYITAVQTGLDRNYQPMETLFSEIIEKSISASAGEQ